MHDISQCIVESLAINQVSDDSVNFIRIQEILSFSFQLFL